MNPPKKEITRCGNPECPSRRASFSGEWVLIRAESVQCYTDGSETVAPVYFCPVCQTWFRRMGGSFIPIHWALHE